MPARLRVLSRQRTGHSRPISHRIIQTTLFIQASITMVTKIPSVETVTIIPMKHVRQRVEKSGDVGICLYRQCSGALLDRACAKRDNLGAWRTMERQLRGDVSCSGSHRVSINSRGQGGSASVAPRSESPGFATVEPRETRTAPSKRDLSRS